jgi:hypothetical protein
MESSVWPFTSEKKKPPIMNHNCGKFSSSLSRGKNKVVQANVISCASLSAPGGSATAPVAAKALVAAAAAAKDSGFLEA